MKASLEYIDNVMDRAIEAEHESPTLPKEASERATKRGQKVIGGFRVHDEAEEKKALDEMIAKRHEAIAKFRADRSAVRDKLSGLGVKPLAVCPTGAWNKICRDAELFVFQPDDKGRVCISHTRIRERYQEKTIDKDVAKNWLAFLKNVMPDFREPVSHLKATFLLPDPPKDVADTLCKAQSLKLKVAAVSEAITMLEKPSELWKNAVSPQDLWAQERGYADYADWLKRDPIIFTEHETAVAVIAQFGDFPIEQAVVDATVKSDALLPDKPAVAGFFDIAGSGMLYISPEEQYRTMMQQQMLLNQQALQRASHEAQQRGIYQGLQNSQNPLGGLVLR